MIPFIFEGQKPNQTDQGQIPLNYYKAWVVFILIFFCQQYIEGINCNCIQVYHQCLFQQKTAAAHDRSLPRIHISNYYCGVNSNYVQNYEEYDCSKAMNERGSFGIYCCYSPVKAQNRKLTNRSQPFQIISWISNSLRSGCNPFEQDKIIQIQAKSCGQHQPSKNYILRIMACSCRYGRVRKRFLLFLFYSLMIRKQTGEYQKWQNCNHDILDMYSAINMRNSASFYLLVPRFLSLLYLIIIAIYCCRLIFCLSCILSSHFLQIIYKNIMFVNQYANWPYIHLKLQIQIFHIQPYQFNFAMIPSKRSSVSSNKHHSSMVQIDLQPILDSQKVQKSIQYIKQSLKNHLKDKKYDFQKTELKQLYKLANIIQQHYMQTNKDNDSIIVALKQQLQKIKGGQQQKMMKIKQKCNEEYKELQRNHNQKILAINNNFGRKYQNYKQIIEKLTKNLHISQRIHQNNHNKMLNLTKCLTIAKQNNKHQQNISKGIKQIVQQITLRQQNSFISSKSDEISIDQIDISHKKYETNLIEDDSMSQVDENRFTPIEKKLEIWLCRLICYGLFQKKNEEMIKRLITFTSKYEQAGQIIKENSVFNLMLQYFINNMKNNHEEAKKYLQGSLSFYETQEQYSQVQLRNINNLSELSINESHQDDLNFKKK